MNRSYKYYDLARLKFHATGFLVQLHKSEFIFHLGLEDKSLFSLRRTLKQLPWVLLYWTGNASRS